MEGGVERNKKGGERKRARWGGGNGERVAKYN